MKSNALAFSVIAIALSVLGWTSSAGAAQCTNDVDCPGTACGTQVCSWFVNPNSHTCVDAGTGAPGQDGWCTVDTDCKCHDQGATCNATFCTTTLPKAGSGSGASSGTASSGTATSHSGTSASGTSASGTSASGTSASGTSASGTSTASGTSAPATTSTKSGCSIGQPGSSSSPWGFGLVAVGACVAFSRRRRA